MWARPWRCSWHATAHPERNPLVLLESEKPSIQKPALSAGTKRTRPTKDQILYIERTLISPPPPAWLLRRGDQLPALAVPSSGQLVACLEVVERMAN